MSSQCPYCGGLVYMNPMQVNAPPFKTGDTLGEVLVNEFGGKKLDLSELREKLIKALDSEFWYASPIDDKRRLKVINNVFDSMEKK